MNKDAGKVNPIAVVVAVVVAAVVSWAWYSPFLFGNVWMRLRDTAPTGAIAPWKPLVEIVREFVVAYVVARFVARLRIESWQGALSLGFWVWLGFPVAMLVGASLWDNKSWTLSLIHSGDWFLKMLAISVTVTLWGRGQRAGHQAKAATQALAD